MLKKLYFIALRQHSSSYEFIPFRLRTTEKVVSGVNTEHVFEMVITNFRIVI
jgi:CRISPR/Cas system CMR subunit Cmr6 (Cas7 group RAMP superfamily)